MKTLTKISIVLGALAAVAPAAQADPTATRSSPALGEVKFRFDSSALPGNAARLLDGAVRFAAAHPDQRIVLDAHCDPIGTSPYNVGLAVRRAESVRGQLVARGVPADQVVLAIYGEDGARRATYADDRRVTLWPTRQPLVAVIDHTLAGKGTAVTWNKPLTTAQLEARPQPVASRQASR
ncbi:MAG TPA: OmpA family protein [Kofleriaceae bacterium]|jgi:peptidoglycan-associated lipoprotein|nr:OmpA family protein [Kofleriaceae bacterium]